MSAEPTGKCWCGCGKKPKKRTSLFMQGHDRRAEQALLEIVYGQSTVADILEMLGYSPEKSICTARDRLTKQFSAEA